MNLRQSWLMFDLASEAKVANSLLRDIGVASIHGMANLL
jgi:hypothetical protein